MSSKKFVARFGLDNNNQTLSNVANPVLSTDAVNKGITDSITNFAQSAYNTANNVGTQIQPAYDKANSAYDIGSSASSNTIYLSGALDQTNTNIVNANTQLKAYVDGQITNTLNYSNGIDDAQNTRISTVEANTIYLFGALDQTNTSITSANTQLKAYVDGEVSYISSINNSQNTNISTATNLAQGAYDTANLKFNTSGGTITGPVTISSNLTITGNLTVAGNVTTVSANNLIVTDNMIYLNDNNQVTNPDLGFAGNYNDGIYRHAGFFRDASDGYWKVFDQYLPEPDASPYIDTSNASFRIADFQANNVTFGKITSSSTQLVSNLNADYLDGQHGSYYTGYTDTANTSLRLYAEANTGAALTAAKVYTDNANNAMAANTSAINTFVQSAYNTANSASSNTIYQSGVDSTQNTNITAVNSFAQSAYNQANTDYTTITTTAGYYGGTTQIPIINLAANGRISSISNTSITAGATITDDTTTNATRYIVFDDATSGAMTSVGVSSSKLQFNPSTGTLSANVFSGAGTGLTETASNLTANVSLYDSVTTATSGTYYPAIFNATSGTLSSYANNIFKLDVTNNRFVFGDDSLNNNEKFSISVGTDNFSTLYNTSDLVATLKIQNNSTTASTNQPYISLWDSFGSRGWIGINSTDAAMVISGEQGIRFRYGSATMGTSEAARIDTSGNIAVNKTTASYKLDVNGTANTGALNVVGTCTATTFSGSGASLTSIPNAALVNSSITINGSSVSLGETTTISAGATITDDTTTNATRYIVFDDVTSGSMTAVGVSSTKLYFNPSTGTTYSTLFQSLSDETQKTNIVKIENATDTIKQIDGFEFDWKDNGNKSAGVIAQQLEKILPWLVTENEGVKSVNYSGLIAYLIQSNKELADRIEKLENR